MSPTVLARAVTAPLPAVAIATPMTAAAGGAGWLLIGLLLGAAVGQALRGRRQPVAVTSLAAVLALIGGATAAGSLVPDAAWGCYAFGLAAGAAGQWLLRRVRRRARKRRSWRWVSSRGMQFESRDPQDRVFLASGGDEIGELYSQLLYSEDWTVPPDRPPTPPRYANAVLLHDQERVVRGQDPILPGQAVFLRLDIGELSPESQVQVAARFPDWHLPRRDLWLDVVVSSSELRVERWPAEAAEGTAAGAARAAESRFFLPADGGAARTGEAAGSSPYLTFRLVAPSVASRVRARVGYFYRNALVQSQLLTARVGEAHCALEIVADYTLSSSLADLDAIAPRPRLTWLVHDRGDGRHELVVRGEGSAGAAPAVPLSLEASAVDTRVASLRAALRSEAVAPARRQRTRRQLEQDLRRLAPLGQDLYNVLTSQVGSALDAAFHQPEATVIQICRPAKARLTLPWALLYEIPLEQDALAHGGVELCPMVRDWNGKGPLFDGYPSHCPAAPAGRHLANVWCPFGFWGFRYLVEQLSSTGDWVDHLTVAPGADFVIAETRRVDPSRIAAHVRRLTATVQGSFPAARVQEGRDRAKIKEMIGRDVPFIYFYCHGERQRPGRGDTYLGVGLREAIAANDFQGWVDNWRLFENRVVWDRIQPFIFLNACHSLEVTPETLVSYLDAFIGKGRAAGVIGTEVRVRQPLAMEIAEAFFQGFLNAPPAPPGRAGQPLGDDVPTVGRVLRKLRLDLLRSGNLAGLVYTPHCWSDLHVVRPAVIGAA